MNEAHEHLNLERMRCTQLEEALAAAQFKGTANSAQEDREQAMEMQNGSHSDVVDKETGPLVPPLDATIEPAAAEMELQERLLDVQQQLVKERDHTAALLEDVTRLETSSADAVLAAQSVAAAAEVRQVSPSCPKKFE